MPASKVKHDGPPHTLAHTKVELERLKELFTVHGFISC
jgi:hypothetical protein